MSWIEIELRVKFEGFYQHKISEVWVISEQFIATRNQWWTMGETERLQNPRRLAKFRQTFVVEYNFATVQHLRFVFLHGKNNALLGDVRVRLSELVTSPSVQRPIQPLAHYQSPGYVVFMTKETLAPALIPEYRPSHLVWKKAVPMSSAIGFKTGARKTGGAATDDWEEGTLIVLDRAATDQRREQQPEEPPRGRGAAALDAPLVPHDIAVVALHTVEVDEQAPDLPGPPPSELPEFPAPVVTLPPGPAPAPPTPPAPAEPGPPSMPPPEVAPPGSIRPPPRSLIDFGDDQQGAPTGMPSPSAPPATPVSLPPLVPASTPGTLGGQGGVPGTLPGTLPPGSVRPVGPPPGTLPPSLLPPGSIPGGVVPGTLQPGFPPPGSFAPAPAPPGTLPTGQAVTIDTAERAGRRKSNPFDDPTLPEIASPGIPPFSPPPFEPPAPSTSPPRGPLPSIGRSAPPGSALPPITSPPRGAAPVPTVTATAVPMYPRPDPSTVNRFSSPIDSFSGPAHPPPEAAPGPVTTDRQARRASRKSLQLETAPAPYYYGIMSKLAGYQGPLVWRKKLLGSKTLGSHHTYEVIAAFGNVYLYKDKEPASTPVDILRLQHAKIEIHKSNGVDITPFGGDKHSFAAASPEEAELWVQMLQSIAAGQLSDVVSPDEEDDENLFARPRAGTDSQSQAPPAPATLPRSTFAEVADVPGTYRQAHNPYSFVSYVQSGTKINLMVAIDFTVSNGDYRSQKSLHHIAPGSAPNEYMQAIQAIGTTLHDYALNRHIPVFGFGGKPGGRGSDVSHCFPVNNRPEDPTCDGFDGIMRCYTEALGRVELSAPTNFTDVFNTACTYAAAEEEKQSPDYWVLLLLTDGEITEGGQLDFVMQCINTLVFASTLPLSIIIIGVGDDAFVHMGDIESRDRPLVASNGEVATRRVVEFVPFRLYRDTERLARHVLQSIPDQMLTYMALKRVHPRNRVDETGRVSPPRTRRLDRWEVTPPPAVPGRAPPPLPKMEPPARTSPPRAPSGVRPPSMARGPSFLDSPGPPPGPPPDALPFGWEERRSSDGHVFWVDLQTDQVHHSLPTPSRPVHPAPAPAPPAPAPAPALPTGYAPARYSMPPMPSAPAPAAPVSSRQSAPPGSLTRFPREVEQLRMLGIEGVDDATLIQAIEDANGDIQRAAARLFR